MRFFTKQEQQIMIFLAVVLTVGSLVQMAIRSYPQLSNYINLIDGNQLYPKVNINVASYDELIAIAYIGKYTANSIIRRRSTSPFKNINEVKSLRGVHEESFKKFSGYLTVGKVD